MHPVLDALEHTPEQWLRNLLLSFNEGNIAKFDSLTPLFPKEVGNSLLIFGFYTNTFSLAYPPTTLYLPAPKDMPNGAHRKCLPEKGIRAYIIIPDYRRRNSNTARRSRALGHESPQVCGLYLW